MAKYENSPPPSDYEFEDIPVFFTFPRPQCVPNPGFLSVDRSLIHPSLLGSKRGTDMENIIENKTNEISQDADKDINKSVNENLKKMEQLNITENDKLIVIAAVDKKSTDKKINEVKKRAHKEAENSSKAEDKSTGQKKRKHHK